jgi:hypothetical protein
MLFSSTKLVSLRSLPLDEKALPRPLFTRKTINKTIKGGDVPCEEQPSRIASSIFGTFTKKVLVSECCGEGCGSSIIPNVYVLNRTGAKPRSGKQAQNNIKKEAQI